MKIEKSGANLGCKQFGVVLADPPWRYNEGTTTPNRRIELQYPTMELDDIAALDVPAVAAESCVLFLWATSPKLDDALEVMRAWGFEYITSAVWVKDKIGTGRWFRGRHELLLVGRKGSAPPPALGTQPESVIHADRREHSRKPDEVYTLIEAMFPSLPKLEMFARAARPGWDAWGAEAEA